MLRVEKSEGTGAAGERLVNKVTTTDLARQNICLPDKKADENNRQMIMKGLGVRRSNSQCAGQRDRGMEGHRA